MICVYDRPELAVEEFAQVGTEVDGDTLGERAVPPHPDTELLADLTARAIGGDEILRAHGLRIAGITVANDRGHAICVLLERQALGREKDLGSMAFSAFLERRLQCVLRQEHANRRADVPDAIVEVGNVVGSRSTGEGLNSDDPGVLDELRFGLGANGLLEPHAAEDFHRALGDRSGSRMNRRAAVMFDHE